MRFRGDFGGSASCHDTDKGELVANIKTRVQKVFFFSVLTLGILLTTQNIVGQKPCVFCLQHTMYSYFTCVHSFRFRLGSTNSISQGM